MMARLPTLGAFMAVPHWTATYVGYREIECYIRKGHRIVNDRIRNVLCIANITNYKCPRNVKFKKRPRPTGDFRRFEAMVRRAALKHGYDGVYVEQVLNEWLPDVLIRYGYEKVNNPHTIAENSYWIQVRGK
jgi:hypothetical protein